MGTQLIAILFVHSFNNVLRILFAINELPLLVPLYTYLYLNKTISDKGWCALEADIFFQESHRS